MKNLITCLLLLFFLNGFSQKKLFENDSIINYHLWQNNSFYPVDSNLKKIPGYIITLKDSLIYENVEKEGYYMVSKRQELSNTSYTAKVLKVNFPNATLKIGDKFHTQLLATNTEEGYVLIKVTINEMSEFFILKAEKRVTTHR